VVVDNSREQGRLGAGDLGALGLNLVVLPAPEAGNAAAVRNLGLRHTGLDTVAFLDDDDLWLPTKMEKQLQFLRSRTDCCAVVCGRRVVAEASQFVEIPSEEQLGALLHYDNFGGSFSFIVLDRSRCRGLYLDEKLTAFQDWDLLIRAARRGRIGVVPEVLAIYNDHRGPRITRTLAGRRQALRRLLGQHGKYMDADARCWMVSRSWDLRAQESSAGGHRGLTRHCVWRSLQWGWRCRIPRRLKYRSLTRRIALLFPVGVAQFLRTAATRLKEQEAFLPGRRPIQ
jgi:glycosyltransferase involved in cell wall biosynthesis